jgi:prepilin-type N-terminal cleavage/methylation domain-containing protein
MKVQEIAIRPAKHGRSASYRGARPQAWDRGGFSLVEMLVAMLLITIGGLAGVVVVRSGVREDQRAYSREVAAALAKQLLEGVDALSYTDACLTATGGATTYATPCNTLSPANPLNAQGQTIVSGGYTRDWSIVNTGGGTKTTANRKTIRVRVRWTDRGTEQLILSGVKGW